MEVVFFGYSRRCAVRATDIAAGPDATMRFTVDGHTYALPVPARHFIYCALPAIYLGVKFGIPLESIRDAISAVQPGPMRGTVEQRRGATFVVDCYNANPSSMKSAIVYLGDVAGNRRRVAIVGDMLELGRYSKRLHMQLGRELAHAGVAKILAVGQFASTVAEGARTGDLAFDSIYTADSSESAVSIARQVINEGDVVLLKGSRGVHLETVYNAFGPEAMQAAAAQ
jgi:UDP-N-acetylmuramoyl-tripeptide--D-alanyl-D-alanine ligase